MKEKFSLSISVTLTSYLFSDILTLLIIYLSLAPILAQYWTYEIFWELVLFPREKLPRVLNCCHYKLLAL